MERRQENKPIEKWPIVLIEKRGAGCFTQPARFVGVCIANRLTRDPDSAQEDGVLRHDVLVTVAIAGGAHLDQAIDLL